MIRFLYCVGLVWLEGATCFAQKAAPDLLVFVNGDQLRGTLVRGVGQEIVFKSVMAGEITVTLDKVKELRSAESFAVLNKETPAGRQRATPGTVVVEGGTLTVTDRVALTESIPVREIGYIIDEATYERELVARPKLYQGWTGVLSGGATLVRSTQNGSTFTGAASLVRSLPLVAFLPRQSRSTLNFTETYGRLTQPVIPQTVPTTPDTVAKTNILHADLERDRYVSTRFYGLAQAAFDHNFSQGLGLQQLYGLGIGWTPVQTARQQLDLKADVHYEKQQFETVASDQNLIGSLIAQAYRRDLPRKLVLTESASILPAWNNLDAYSANASITLALPVFRRLGLTVSSTDNFLNNPAAGFRKNSFQFATGVSYTLR